MDPDCCAAIIYNSIANPWIIDSGKTRCLSVGFEGGKTYFEAANADKNQLQTLLKRATALYKVMIDLIFAAAADANSNNLAATNAVIGKYRN